MRNLSLLFIFACLPVLGNVIDYNPQTGVYRVDQFGSNEFAPKTHKKTPVNVNDQVQRNTCEQSISSTWYQGVQAGSVQHSYIPSYQ